ncbi:hypothetical protein BDB00DRAFT_963804 [Zychaea mexicana]|uniref:uncharacterized protein n=1 Tax=Zychaea mexicana TaxID=64656 RepID=UPI0022FEBEE9|nr:uncharacterized protein BDB00DRAFT_963804 [Zychaea mexicana]KAI9488355.1 hypothetical protein BDB00DRAFT_963804 [Zychaea mexicana]
MAPQQQRRTKKESPYFSKSAAAEEEAAAKAESSNSKKRKSTRQLAKRSSSSSSNKKTKKAVHASGSSSSSSSDNEALTKTTNKKVTASSKSNKDTAKSSKSTTRQPAKTTTTATRARTKQQQKPENNDDDGEEEEEEEEEASEFSDDNDSSDDDFQSPPPRIQKRAHVKPNSNQVDARLSQSAKNKGETTSKSSRTQKTRQTQKKVIDSSEEEEESPASSSSTTTTTTTKTTTAIDIPRPKGAPFADALSPCLLEFLAELREDNNRDFMRTNEKRWHTIRNDFMDFVKMVSEQLNEMDPTVLIEEPKNAIYRQHRDLRFTNDLRPYKSYMSASFSRGGKKSPFAGYYIGVAPNGETHVAAGIWQPSPPRIARIREGIVANADLMREALNLPTIKETLGQSGLAVLSNEDKLKTAPKNFPKDHPEIELLRYKSFVVSKTFSDLEVVSEGFLDKVLDVYEALVPFITILNSWTG